MNHESRNLLWLLPEWLTALGTLLAVIVALYLARRDRLIRCVGNAAVGEFKGSTSGEHPKYVAITTTNIGTRSFTLSNISLCIGIFKKRSFWMKPVENEYSSPLPTKLSDGEHANFFIPVESFLSKDAPEILRGRPSGFSSLWIRSLRMVVHTSTGDSFKFRVDKTLREEILGSSAKNVGRRNAACSE